jgi:mitochondrial fission protein ELM1
MSARLQRIRILSDGKPGHVNQSRGLALALQRRTGAEIETVPLPLERSWRHRLRIACRLEVQTTAPQLVIGAGHRTHLPLLAAARKFGARSIVLMKPSLPARLFSLCLVPQHDMGGRAPRSNVIVTRGALNKLAENVAVKPARGIVMLGGPSAHHEWSAAPLLAALADVVRASPHLAWTIGDSRRTPPGFLEQVASLQLPGEIVPHGQTAEDWLPQQLAAAEEAWITADSTSMVSEAVTAGARTGILPLPARHPDNRVVRAVQLFADEGMVTQFADWQVHGWPQGEPARLHEAARCADEILARFFPE